MKKQRMLFSLFFLILPLVLLFLCTKISPTNPDDDDYKGDYSFTITWDSLASSNTDKLEIFRAYTIPFKSTGLDKYKYYKITDDKGTILADSLVLNSTATGGFISVYFKAPYSGYLYFKAVRPNIKEDPSKSPLSVTVINPYAVAVENTTIAAGESVKARMRKLYDSTLVPMCLKTIWLFNDLDTTKLSWVEPFTQGNITTSDNTLYAGIIDTVFNYLLWIDTVSIQMKGSRPVIKSIVYDKMIDQGDTLSFTIELSDGDKNKLALSITSGKNFYYDSTALFEYDSLKTFKTDKPIVDTGAVVFNIRLKDSIGLASETRQCSVTVLYTLPSPVFAQEYKVIPLDDTVCLSSYDANYQPGNLYVWEWKGAGIIDTTDNYDSFMVWKNDTLLDTVMIHGINPYGMSGKRSMMIIQAKDLDFKLVEVQFSNELRCRHWGTYIVAAVDNSTDTIASDKAAYFWATDPSGVCDIMKTDSNICSLYVSDSIAPFKLSVYAVVEDKDTTDVIGKTVVVRAYRPTFRFKTGMYSGTAGQKTRITMSASDNEKVDSVYLKFHPSAAVVRLGDDTTYDTTFMGPCTVSIKGWAIDNEGFKSAVDSAEVRITSTKPVFSPAVKDTSVFIKDSVELRVYASGGSGVVTRYYWDTDGNGTWNDSTQTGTFTLKPYVDSSTHTVYAGCRNSLGDTAVSRCRITIKVDAGKPVVDMASIKGSYYINTPCTLTVLCYDTNGVIKRLHVDTGTADITVSGHDKQRDTIQAIFSYLQPGTYTVTVRVEDEDTMQSVVYVKLPDVIIIAGTPVVDSIYPMTRPVYIKDSVVYHIVAHDNNGITKYEYSLNDIDWVDSGNSNTFKLMFPTAGKKYIWGRVTDNDANVSKVNDSVDIEIGAPVVDTISRDTVWAMDSLSYVVRFHDENDSVKEVRVSWGDGAADTLQLAGKKDSVIVWHKYGINNDTTYRCTVTVMDNDSVKTSRVFNKRVLRGAPRVDSVWVDTSESWIFMNDQRRFYVKVSDPNDFVDTAYVSWAGGNVAQAAIPLSGTGMVKTGYFAKSFAAGDSGQKPLRFWCRDVDGIESAKRDKAVMVRLGRPMLWGDTGDTTWVIVDSGSGRSYRIHINSRDTNGIISRFYWDEKATFDSTNNCEKTTDSTRMRLISQAEMHYPLLSWIYGRDEDGLLGGKRFVVYADSVPPKPVGLFMQMTDGGDSVQIQWDSTALDGKEGLDTEIKLMYKFGTTGEPDVTLMAYTPARQLRTSGTKRYYKFKKTQTGDILYRVVLRDKRGSETRSEVAPGTISR